MGKRICVGVLVFLLVFLIGFWGELFAQTADFPGEKSVWNGFPCYDFQVAGRPAKVVVPKASAKGKPWVWRAVFFGHEPQTEIAMLEKGWHIAWIGTSDLLGSKQANAERTKLYERLVGEYGFSPKPVLLGMSRGGICSMNWAVENPDKVAGLYLDAPVCVLKSWPGGKGHGVGDPESWKQAQEVYGLSEADLIAFRGNPTDTCVPLAARKIPLLIIAGDADKTVPYDENGAILVENYQRAGGNVQVILKPGVDHHPHSLKDPAVIVEFMLKCAP